MISVVSVVRRSPFCSEVMSRLGAEPQLNGDEIEQSLAIDYRKVVFIVVIEEKNGEIPGRH